MLSGGRDLLLRLQAQRGQVRSHCSALVPLAPRLEGPQVLGPEVLGPQLDPAQRDTKARWDENGPACRSG